MTFKDGVAYLQAGKHDYEERPVMLLTAGWPQQEEVSFSTVLKRMNISKLSTNLARMCGASMLPRVSRRVSSKLCIMLNNHVSSEYYAKMVGTA